MGMGLVLLIDAAYEAAIGALLPETVCIGQLVKQEDIASSVRLDAFWKLLYQLDR